MVTIIAFAKQSQLFGRFISHFLFLTTQLPLVSLKHSLKTLAPHLIFAQRPQQPRVSASQWKVWSPICPVLISFHCQVIKRAHRYNGNIQQSLHQLISHFCCCSSTGSLQCLAFLQFFIVLQDPFTGYWFEELGAIMSEKVRVRFIGSYRIQLKRKWGKMRSSFYHADLYYLSRPR